jgi:hypothetical protein
LPHKFGNEKGMADENEAEGTTTVPPQLFVIVRFPPLGKFDALTTPFNVYVPFEQVVGLSVMRLQFVPPAPGCPALVWAKLIVPG